MLGRQLVPLPRALLATCLFALAACSAPPLLSPAPSSSLPAETALLEPTSPPPSARPAQPAAPGPTPSPTLGLPTPTSASFFPAAPIEIRLPVEGSALVSPLPVLANLHPGHDGLVTLALHGSDGRLLARQILRLPSPGEDGEKVLLETSLHFEIPDPAESARLSLSTRDEYGRPLALSSVALTLLAPESEQTLTALDSPIYPDKIWIQSPAPGQTVPTGPLEISGLLYTDSARPLLIQLITRARKVLGFAEVYPEPPASSGETSFPLYSAQFDLSLDEAQWLQIAVSQRAASPAITTHLSTLEIFYTP